MDQVAWYYYLGGQQVGPVTRAELSFLIVSGQVPLETLVWAPELTNWTPAYAVSTFAALRAAAPALAGQARGKASTEYSTAPVAAEPGANVAQAKSGLTAATEAEDLRTLLRQSGERVEVAAAVSQDNQTQSQSSSSPAHAQSNYNAAAQSGDTGQQSKWGDLDAIGRKLDAEQPLSQNQSQSRGPNQIQSQAATPVQSAPSSYNAAAQSGNTGEQSKWGDLDAIGRKPGAEQPSSQSQQGQSKGQSQSRALGHNANQSQASTPVQGSNYNAAAQSGDTGQQSKWGDLDAIGRKLGVEPSSPNQSQPWEYNQSQAAEPTPSAHGNYNAAAQSGNTGQQSKWGDLDAIGRKPGAEQPSSQNQSQSREYGHNQSQTAAPAPSAQGNYSAAAQSGDTGQHSKWGDLDAIGRKPGAEQPSIQNQSQPREYGHNQSQAAPAPSAQGNYNAASQSGDTGQQSKWGDLDAIGRRAGAEQPSSQNQSQSREYGHNQSQTGAPAPSAQGNYNAAAQSGGTGQHSKWGDLDSIGRTPSNQPNQPSQASHPNPGVHNAAGQSNPGGALAQSGSTGQHSKWGDLDSIGNQPSQPSQSSQPNPDVHNAAGQSNPGGALAQSGSTDQHSKWGNLDSIGRTPSNQPNQPSQASQPNPGVHNAAGQRNPGGALAQSGSTGQHSKWGDLDSIGRSQASNQWDSGGQSVAVQGGMSQSAISLVKDENSGYNSDSGALSLAKVNNPAGSLGGDSQNVFQESLAEITAASSSPAEESSSSKSKWGDLGSLVRKATTNNEAPKPSQGSYSDSSRGGENSQTGSNSSKADGGAKPSGLAVAVARADDELKAAATRAAANTTDHDYLTGLSGAAVKADAEVAGRRPQSGMQWGTAATSTTADSRAAQATTSPLDRSKSAFGQSTSEPTQSGSVVQDDSAALHGFSSSRESTVKDSSSARFASEPEHRETSKWGDLDSIVTPGMVADAASSARNTAEVARNNPELFFGSYLKNPYRVLGLTGAASQSEVKKTLANIRRQAKIGKPYSSPNDLPWCGSISRAERDLLDAETKLLNPESRLQSRLLWFHSALELPGELSAREAAEFADQIAGQGQPFSRHDAAVLLQFAAIADSPECKREEYWKRAIAMWNEVLNDEPYWDFLCELDDQLGFEPVCLSSDVFAQKDNFLALVTDPLVALSKDALNSGNRDIFARTANLLNNGDKPASNGEPGGSSANSELVDEFFRLIDGASNEIDELLNKKVQRSENNSDEVKRQNAAVCKQCEQIYSKQVSPVMVNAQSVLGKDDPVLLQLRGAAADCLDSIASGYSWTDDLDSSIRLLHQAQPLALGTSAEPKVREHTESLEQSRKYKEVFANDKPIKSAPSLFTINSIGCMIYPALGEQPDPVMGAKRAIYYFVIAYIPIFPLASYRVIFEGGNGYRFMSRLPLDKWAYLHQLTSVFLFVFLIFAAAKSGAELDERQRVEAETRIRGAIAGVKENVVIPTEKYDLKGFINADDRVLAMLEKQLDQLKLQKDAKETAIKSSLQNVQNGIKAGMDKTKLNAMKAAHNKMVDEYDKIIASGKARFAFYERVRTERNNAADKWNKLYANR